mmetsp:Transcript_65714/g.129276  ORF Transcript_65714/g.129276 Transcript_65714/m.129276 type:complete len:218 (-) Transcript_65714:168-821(-)
MRSGRPRRRHQRPRRLPRPRRCRQRLRQVRPEIPPTTTRPPLGRGKWGTIAPTKFMSSSERSATPTKSRRQKRVDLRGRMRLLATRCSRVTSDLRESGTPRCSASRSRSCARGPANSCGARACDASHRRRPRGVADQPFACSRMRPGAAQVSRQGRGRGKFGRRARWRSGPAEWARHRPGLSGACLRIGGRRRRTRALRAAQSHANRARLSSPDASA